MKCIYLLRHAKSDWSIPVGGDHERPLNPRGIRAAGRIGRLLRAVDGIPDLVITSTAVRARSTVEIAQREGEWTDTQIVEVSRLYGAGATELLRVVRGLPADVDCAMLAGHEPGWSDAVSRFIGGGRIRMATATLARIDFDVDSWTDCAFGRGQLAALLPPRMLD